MNDTTKGSVSRYLAWINSYVEECMRRHGTANINECPPGYMVELAAIMACTIMDLQKHSAEFQKK